MELTLVNPIISKELKDLLRSKRALLLTLVYVCVLSLLVLAMWPTEGVNPAGGLRARSIFSVMIGTQLAMLLLFAPPLAANAITAEKDANTYESLYCTHLSATAIVLGKLTGAVGFLLALVLFSLPIGAAVLALGGVGVGEFFVAYLILAASGLFFGMAGITFSALMRKAFTAMIATYALLIIVCGLVHLPPIIMSEWRAGFPIMHFVRSISPFSAALAVTQNAFRPLGTGADAMVVYRFFAFFVVSMVILMALSIVGAKMSAARSPSKRGEDTGQGTVWRRILRRIMFVIDPKKKRRPIPTWVNPIIVLEFRTRTASLSNMIRAVFACLIFSALLVILVFGPLSGASMDMVRLIAISFQFGLIILLAPSLTVGAVSSEIENKTFDQVRMTKIKPMTIMIGKIGAALGYSVLLLVAIVPIFLAVMFVRERFEPEHIKAVVAVAGSTILVAVTWGLFASALFKKTSAAAALTYGLMGFLVVVTALAGVLEDKLDESVATAILTLNPVIAVISVMSDELFARYEIWQTNAILLCVLSGVAIIGAILRLKMLVEPTK